MWQARLALDGMTKETSMFLGTSRRAAAKLNAAIDAVFPRDIDAIMNLDKEAVINWWSASAIHTALSELESVLGNDMPGIAAYIVAKKGIYDTDDLIAHAEN